MCCPLSTCPCIFLAGAGAATCPPSSWFPAPAEHAPWPAPGGQPVSAAVWGKGRCRRGGWPAGGAVVPERCFLAAAPPKAHPPGLGDLEGRDRAEGEWNSVSYAFLVQIKYNVQLPPQQIMAATKRARSLSSSSRELKRVANWNLGSIMSLNGRRRLLRNSRVMKPPPRATRRPSLFMQEARRVKRAS